MKQEKPPLGGFSFPNLSDAIQYFKDDAKGVSEVCAIVEKLSNDKVKDVVIKMIQDDCDNDTIKKYTTLTDEAIDEIRFELS